MLVILTSCLIATALVPLPAAEAQPTPAQPTPTPPLQAGQVAVGATEPATAADEPQATRKSLEWTDKNGNFLLRGSYFSANRDTVVISRRNERLVAIDRASLSDASNAQVVAQQQAVADAVPEAERIGQWQTWMTRDGFELRGRVIAFGEKQVEYRRIPRSVRVNGSPFSRLSSFNQHVAMKIVAEFDSQDIETEDDLRRWASELGTETRTFTVQGVMLELEDGTELQIPFFLFAEADLAALRPGFDQWAAGQREEGVQDRENFLLRLQAEEQARGRLQDRQIQMMQVNLLAVNAGITTVWEVFLVPRPGVYARPMSVVVPARDSLTATQMALAQYPGYVDSGVRALSR